MVLQEETTLLQIQLSLEIQDIYKMISYPLKKAFSKDSSQILPIGQ